MTRIKLDDKQFEELETVFSIEQGLEEALAGVLIEALGRFAKERNKAWESVRALLGAERSDVCRINWITREVYIAEQEEPDGDA